MLDIKSYDILSPGFNSELVEIVEKAWIKSSATTKEQKEKNLNDIFHVYLEKLNKSLKENETSDISDLIMEKSFYITETTGAYEWPRAETLKVSELHRLTLYLYNYSKYKFAIQAGFHNTTKDLAFKAFENLAKFLEILAEFISFELSEDLLSTIYHDVFYFYVKTRESNTTEDLKAKAKEDLQLILDSIYEETSKENNLYF